MRLDMEMWQCLNPPCWRIPHWLTSPPSTSGGGLNLAGLGVRPIMLGGEDALLELVGVVVFEVATMWALVLRCVQRAEDPTHDNLFLDEIRHWQLRLAGTTTSFLSSEDGGNSSMYRTIDVSHRRARALPSTRPHLIQEKWGKIQVAPYPSATCALGGTAVAHFPRAVIGGGAGRVASRAGGSTALSKLKCMLLFKHFINPQEGQVFDSSKEKLSSALSSSNTLLFPRVGPESFVHVCILPRHG
jgi:hypothetical protein